MKSSTIEKKYSKKALVDMINRNREASDIDMPELKPLDFSKAELVQMVLPIFNAVEADVPEVKGDVMDNVNMQADEEAELDNALRVVLKEGILYRIDSHCWWGKTSRVPEDEIDIPKQLMGGVKTLIDPKHLGPFRQWKGIGERIVKKCGYSFLGLRGVYFVPKGFIGLAEEKLLECQKMAAVEKDNFKENFELYKQEWKAYVIDMCVEHGIDVDIATKYLEDSYYPSVSQLDGKFVFQWTKFAVTVPDSDMGILTDKQYQEEVRKQKVQAREFLNNCVAELAKRFYEIISNIKAKLDAGDVIKPKTLQSLESFTEVFDKMNITNNQELAGYVGQAQKLFSGVSVADFKEDKFTDKLKTKLTGVVDKFAEAADQKLLRDIEF